MENGKLFVRCWYRATKTRLFIPCPSLAQYFYDGKVHAHQLAPYCPEYSSLYRPRRKSKRRQKYFPERSDSPGVVVSLSSLCRPPINVSVQFSFHYVAVSTDCFLRDVTLYLGIGNILIQKLGYKNYFLLQNQSVEKYELPEGVEIFRYTLRKIYSFVVSFIDSLVIYVSVIVSEVLRCKYRVNCSENGKFV